MELTDRTKPVDNKVKPVLFDQFQKSADWMVPRGRFYYTPMGAFTKGMTGGDIFVCLFINCLIFGTFWRITSFKYDALKIMHLSVNVFSTKVLIGDTIFTSPKILNIGPVPGIEPEIEPAISRSAVKRSTDWANPAAV